MNTELHGLELVKQDLRNHFMTRLGERRGRPQFGSIIHDLLMEPFDDQTEADVLADARRIIQSDPRVRENSVVANVDLDGHSITISAKLIEVETNMEDNFSVTFSETP